MKKAMMKWGTLANEAHTELTEQWNALVDLHNQQEEIMAPMKAKLIVIVKERYLEGLIAYGQMEQEIGEIKSASHGQLLARVHLYS